MIENSKIIFSSGFFLCQALVKTTFDPKVEVQIDLVIEICRFVTLLDFMLYTMDYSYQCSFLIFLSFRTYAIREEELSGVQPVLKRNLSRRRLSSDR